MFAWIPFPLYRQAFSRFSACLDSSFSYQASILSLFRLPGLLFFLSGKHFPAFPLAWIPLFASQASIFSLFRLPGLFFFLSGKHFPAFPLAWIPLFPIRQAFPRFSVCPDFTFGFQAVGCTLNRLSRLQNSNLGSSIFQEFTVPFLKIQSRQFIMTEIHCLNGNNQKQPVANHCLFAQIQMRTVNSLIISLSECQIRKRDSYKGHFTSHEGSVPSGEVFSDKIRVSE
jgi:hypothetical protein